MIDGFGSGFCALRTIGIFAIEKAKGVFIKTGFAGIAKLIPS
jgi:hypothetical protein